MTEAVTHHDTIEAVDFKPGGGDRGPGFSLRSLLLWAAFALLLLVLAAALWLFTGQSVRIDVQPTVEQVELKGSRWALKLADRWLLQPGQYTVAADLPGYHPLREVIEVDNQPEQSFSFELRKLPGRLSVTSVPAAEGTVLVAGEELGPLPLAEVKLEPGVYLLDIVAPRFKPYQAEVEIEGGDIEQHWTAELEPAWADIAINSEPLGATVLVDGQPAGQTPLTAEIVEGERELEIQLAGYQPWFIDLTVVADQPQTLPTVTLKKANYQVRVVSTPSAAGVTIDGEYRGQTPLNLKLAPDSDYRLGLSKSGYRAARRQLSVKQGEVSNVSVTLQPILGAVELSGTPADAQVLVDGVVRGSLNQTLRLPARPHQLQIRKAGYQDYTASVTPNPSLPQRISVALLTTREIRESKMPPTRQAGNGYPLRLIRPDQGVVRLGSPRREQGRRSNESIRQVRLKRPFYIGTREVTNADYAAFDIEHDSGVVDRNTLALKKQPVVRVNWQRAAAFCNWLSQRDNLPPAYVEGGNGLEPAKPMTTGYRLPSEAEWALVARYAGDSDATALRFPWGAQMPPTPGSGNYAGIEAVNLTARSLSNYQDNYAVSAEVGQFPANAIQINDLGGNVREWMHDWYAIRGGAGSIATDPLGPAEGEGHVIRGSSWRSGSLSELRLAYRDSSSAAHDDVGFRVVRYAE